MYSQAQSEFQQNDSRKSQIQFNNLKIKIEEEEKEIRSIDGRKIPDKVRFLLDEARTRPNEIEDDRIRVDSQRLSSIEMRNKPDEVIKKQEDMRKQSEKMRSKYEEIRIKPDRVRFSPDTIFSPEIKSSPESRYNQKIRNSPDDTRINTFSAHNSDSKSSTTMTATSLNDSQQLISSYPSKQLTNNFPQDDSEVLDEDFEIEIHKKENEKAYEEYYNNLSEIADDLGMQISPYFKDKKFFILRYLYTGAIVIPLLKQQDKQFIAKILNSSATLKEAGRILQLSRQIISKIRNKLG